MFATVLGERGGAPLHFLLVHIAAWLSPTLTAVRLISVVFAVASIPVIAALLSRLAGRRLALVGTVLVAASWVLLFHGIYGRMYSLFLFTSPCRFSRCCGRSSRRRPLDWGLWGLALLATLSCHQYGAFILGIEVVFAAVLWRRDRFPLVAPLVALAVVVAAAAPIWRSNLVLASRFDVGVGDGARSSAGRCRCSSTFGARSATSWPAGSPCSRSSAPLPSSGSGCSSANGRAQRCWPAWSSWYRPSG